MHTQIPGHIYIRQDIQDFVDKHSFFPSTIRTMWMPYQLQLPVLSPLIKTSFQLDPGLHELVINTMDVFNPVQHFMLRLCSALHIFHGCDNTHPPKNKNIFFNRKNQSLLPTILCGQAYTLHNNRPATMSCLLKQATVVIKYHFSALQ